jgi:hypothetical protein
MGGEQKMPKFVPMLTVSSHVGEKTRLWWEQIGRSLVSFTEVEQAVIDWAVFFSDDKSLWKSRFMDDLKALVPELRRSLRKAGVHRLSAATKATLEEALSQVEALTQPRNDIAHMRLIFIDAPSDKGWILTASHVQVRKRTGKRFVLAQRDLDWIRSTARAAKNAGKSLNTIMHLVKAELCLDS